MSHSFGGSISRQDPHPSFPPHGGPIPAGSRDGGSGSFGGRFGPFTDMLTYRLICPDEKVGGVIGKGGTIVKALKHETGCDIRVLEKMPESDDRIIIISGPAVLTVTYLRFMLFLCFVFLKKGIKSI